MNTPQGFQGRIGRTVADSEEWFSEPPHPGEGAPNVVLVLLDDTGFAQMGCYGSDIETPHIDALAAGGLQFTNFHVTPLCSPTRAALVSGRSNHAVGMRSVANFRTGFPNQLGHVSDHAATVAEVLHDAGYATFMVGKWHLAPMEQCSAAGPFDQWPLARGFDRFYGFLDGETDQFHPELIADNHPVDPPATTGEPASEGYHLSEDLVDRALAMIADSTGVRPDRPFLCYLAFGATHAPHQAPPSYLAKYRGRFDDGWDAARERIHRRQVERGIIPEGTVLSPHNPGVLPWDDLSEAERLLATRLQEAFAAFLDHTDDQIGRFVDGLRRLDRLDDTIFVLMSDNGASQEGGPQGVLHEMKWFNGIVERPEEAIARLDDIGGPSSHTNYPWGWAQCGNTPYRWYKQNTHEGGVHVPMIVHWPGGIPAGEAGTRRDQFVFASDVVPTIYEVLGVEPPTVRRGSSSCRSPGTRSPHCWARAGPTHRRRTRCSTSRTGAAGRSSPASGRRSPSTSRATTTTPSPGSCTTSPPTAPSAPTWPTPSPTGWPSWSPSGGRRPTATASSPSTTGASSCSAPASGPVHPTRRTAATCTGPRWRPSPRRRPPPSAVAAST